MTATTRRTDSLVSRRRFLRRSQTALLAAAAGGLASRRAFAAGDEPQARKVVVGAHPWVYAATQPNHDVTPILDRIFADMRYAGMEGIELMHTALRPADAVKRIAALVEKHDLPVIGTSFGGPMWDRRRRAEVLDDAELVISRLAKLGGKTLGTSVGSARRKKTPDDLDAQAELLERIMAACRPHGVALNLHNHTYEVENDLHDLKGTLARIPSVRLGPDLDWLVQAGVDPVEFLLRFGERIVFLHLRDQKADKTWGEAMGEGDMDYAAVAKALRKIGFAGHAVIELAHPRGFQPTRPLRESLKISRQYVRDTLGY
ncbi:MAG: sugar phosphate isomerase/epimerase family protein [Planctomycetota bacterium]|jgi:sugar phosphate isomerase/epimerase